MGAGRREGWYGGGGSAVWGPFGRRGERELAGQSGVEGEGVEKVLAVGNGCCGWGWRGKMEKCNSDVVGEDGERGGWGSFIWERVVGRCACCYSQPSDRVSVIGGYCGVCACSGRGRRRRTCVKMTRPQQGSSSINYMFFLVSFLAAPPGSHANATQRKSTSSPSRPGLEIVIQRVEVGWVNDDIINFIRLRQH